MKSGVPRLRAQIARLHHARMRTGSSRFVHRPFLEGCERRVLLSFAAEISGPTNTVPGRAETFTLGTDAGDPAGTEYLFEIDFDGDGNADQSVTGPVGTTVDQVYGATGDFTVSVTATRVSDSEVGDTAGTLDVNVDSTQLLGDSLLVGGTSGNDLIQTNDVGGGQIQVSLDGVSQGSFSGVEFLFVFGGDGDDEIRMESTQPFRTTIEGGLGDDLIFGGDRREAFFGGEGNDVIDGGRGLDTLFGDTGDDLLLGGNSRDVLNGGDGQDTLGGNGGADSLFGDAGDDELGGGNGDDLLSGGDGIDTLFGSNGSDTLRGGEGDDSLVGNNGLDQLEGNVGDDTLRGARGGDTLFGGPGNDNLQGLGGPDELFGQAGDDVLLGGREFDDLDGGDGNDTLNGENGNDDLIGGVGNDLFLYMGTDAAHLHRLDLNPGGQLRFRTFDPNDFTLLELDRITSDSDDSFVLNGMGGDDTIGVIAGIPISGLIDGGADDDTINNQVPGMSLSGGTGDDTINGSGTDDVGVLNNAGPDDDRSFAFQVVNGNLQETRLDRDTNEVLETNLYFDIAALDIFGSSVGERLDASTFNFGVLFFSDITLRGEGGDDTLVGADNIDDVLIGGDGNDMAMVPGTNEAELFQVDPSNELVRVRRTLASDTGTTVEMTEVTDVETLVVDGSGGDDTLDASGMDVAGLETAQVDLLELRGGDGADTLTGSAGDDLLDGGADNDSLLGGDGNDTLDGGAGNDIAIGEGGADDQLRVRGDSTDDRLFADIVNNNFVVDRQVGNGPVVETDEGDTEILEMMGLGGRDTLETDSLNSRRYIMDGGADNDLLNGTNSTDTLLGGAGDDQLNSNGGNDSVDGQAGNDVLRGSFGNDFLFGNEGNDTLIGDTGDNTLVGGLGTDALNGGNGANNVMLVLGTEMDERVELSNPTGGQLRATTFQDGNQVSQDNAINMDLLLVQVLDGNDTVDSTLSDGDLNDVDLTGATIEGGLGDDVLEGTPGDDLIEGEEGSDSIDGGSGADQINGDVGDDTLNGGGGDDNVQGQDGDDVLDGGSGNDLVEGSVGNDVVLGGAGDDVVNGGEGDDTLDGGADADTVNGGVGNDSLTGGGGTDQVNGEDGDDTLGGGGGDDALNGGAGADTVVFEGTEGSETLLVDMSGSQVRYRNAPTVTTLVDLPNFNGANAVMTTNGSANFVDNGGSDILQITPASGGQAGAAWFNERINVANGFEMTFEYRIANPGGGGADGFAMVIQNSPDGVNEIRASGGAMAYDGMPNSLAVEFDNWAGGGEPDANHVAIHSAGTGANSATTNGGSHVLGVLTDGDLGFTLEDGVTRTARVVFQAGTFSVFPDFTNQPDLVLSIGVDLATLLDLENGTDAFVGFTGGTGGATADQEILSWEIIGTSGSETDLFTFDDSDMIMLLALGGDDTLQVNAAVPLIGTVDGGDGEDDCSAVPDTWEKINCES